MFDGQPGNTAVFGNPTYFADLSIYSGEITQIMGPAEVPEPGSLALVLSGSLAGGFFWRRVAAVSVLAAAPNLTVQKHVVRSFPPP